MATMHDDAPHDLPNRAPAAPPSLVPTLIPYPPERLDLLLDVPTGWRSLVEDALDLCRPVHGLCVADAKTHRGQLAIRLRMAASVDVETVRRVHEQLEAIEAAAATTCTVCGGPGSAMGYGEQRDVRCSDHRPEGDEFGP